MGVNVGTKSGFRVGRLVLPHGTSILTGDGAPVDGVAGTGAKLVGKGSLYLDYTNAAVYVNTNTQASPTWTAIATIGAGSVNAAALAAAVGAAIQGTPTFTPGAEAGGNQIDVTIQLKDFKGTNLAAKHVVKVWLSDAAGGALCAVAPSGAVTVETGVKLSEATAKTEFSAVSDATGVIVVRIIEAGVKTVYLNVEYQGKVFSSGAVTFA